MDILKYEATLPAVPPNTDVQSQTLTVTVDGVAGEPQELASDATVATFEVPQDSAVDLSLTYSDGTNTSEARTQSFVAVDTIAPEAPGEFGEIKLVSERSE